MKINHRITLSAEDPRVAELERAGVEIDRNDTGIWVFNVTEDAPAWPEVRRIAPDLLKPWCVSTIYTEEELNAAEYLDVVALGHHGYPQPEKNAGYVQQTYDTHDHCTTCGIGGHQTAPFRMRKAPGARQSQFLQLNWVFDEYFVTNAVLQGLASAGISGVEFVAPVVHKTGQPIAEIAQMKIIHTLPPSLHSDGLQPVTCKLHNEEDRPDGMKPLIAPEAQPYCGRVKFHKLHKGPLRFDRAAFDEAPDVVKSGDWFGSGGSAFQLVLASQKFRRLVLANKWRGITFEPVQLVAA
jgi:hypothetical protein